MNNQRLHRANSFIRARKERAGNLLKNRMLFDSRSSAQNQDIVGSFLTIPNAFRQCTIPLRIIHSAIPNALKEKLPDCLILYVPVMIIFLIFHSRFVKQIIRILGIRAPEL